MVPLVCALASTLYARVARGEATAGTPVELEWNAPVECPTGSSVEAEVVRLSKSGRSTERWHARASVARVSEHAWTLHLATELQRRSVERDFTARSCAELAAVVAVVLAVSVDPEEASASVAMTSRSIAPPLPSAPAPAPPSPARALPALAEGALPRPTLSGAAPLPEPSPEHLPAATSLHVPPFAIAVDARASLGVLASPALGIDVGLAWTPSHARLELEGLWFPSAEVTGAGAAGAFALGAGELAGCWMPLDGAIALGPCLAVEAGALRAHATGAGITSTPATSAWVAGEAGALIVWRPLPHFGLSAGLDLEVPFVRENFTVSSRGTVHHASPVGAEGTLGAEAHFP